MEQGQPGTEPSLDEAALSIAQNIISGEEGPPRDETGKFAPTKPKEAEPEAQEEQPEAEQEEQPPEEGEEKPSLRFKVRYKADDDSDVEAEVDADELVKGYMLEKDYRRKTAAVAREREALQQKIKESVEPKVSEYEKSLETFRQAVLVLADREGANVDLNKLAETDPVKAQQLFFKRLEFNNTLQAITQKQQELMTQRQQEMKSAYEKSAREAVEALQTEIPGWNNELYGKILEAGRKHYGFKAEEVNAITDPRAIKVLNDARQWREFKSAKPSVEKRSTPQAPKVVKPGAGERKDAGAEKWKEGMANLRKSGRTEDAVELAKLLLAREQ